MQQKLITAMNWAAYLLFIAIFAAAYLFYRGYVLLLLLFVLIFMIPVSIGAALYLRTKVTAECFFDSVRVQREEPFLLTVSLDNRAFVVSRNVFLEVVLENAFAERKQKHCLVLPLRTGKKTEVTLSGSGTCCGKLVCRITGYKISDWFGLVMLNGRRKGGGELFLEKEQEGGEAAVFESSILILPKLCEVSELPERAGGREGEQEIVLEDKKGTESSEIISFREYVPGDRQKNIHWKLSSKSENFLVKEYGDTVNNEITLLLDLKKGPQNDVLELFFSVGSRLCGEGRQFHAVFMENGELVSEAVTTEDGFGELLERIYDEQPGKLSVASDYKKLFGAGDGGTLLIGRESGLSAENNVQESLFARYGEAVAVWI